MQVIVKLLIVFFGLLMLAPQASAQTVALVLPERGGAWWIGKIHYRPIHKSIIGVSVDEINKWRAANGNVISDVCYVDALTKKAFYAPQREKQWEIDKTFNDLNRNPFRITFQPVPEKTFVGTTIAMEFCNKETSVGLVVTNQTDGKLVYFDSFPNKFGHIYRLKEGNLGMSSCFFCGDGNVLYYDNSRGKFYWEYTGD